MKTKVILACMAITASGVAVAQTYNLDPNHTYPSFESDHMGISILRGKFTRTKGTVTFDRAAKTGTMDIEIDTGSIDFGHAKLNQQVKSAELFNVEKFPTATYKGRAIKFNGDTPVAVEGDLTLLGVTRPVNLKINKFKCIENAMLKRETCGADASAEFNRADFGMTYGVPKFTAPEIKLAIQVEAIKSE